MIKAVFIDIDETLTNSQREVTEKTKLEIWNKATWEKCDENISADEIAENMTMLGI